MVISQDSLEENPTVSTECSNSEISSFNKSKYAPCEAIKKKVYYYEEKLFKDTINYGLNSELYTLESNSSHQRCENYNKLLPCLSLVLMLMLSIFLCYADRIIMPSCIKYISEEFRFSKSDQGFILGLFYAGYIWTQIIGGYIADTSRLGGKGVLFIGVLFWSLCMVGTSIIAYLGIIGFILFRISLGIGEGVSFPAVNSIVGHYIPAKYSSTVISIIIASSYIGGGFAAFVTPPMIQKMGWRGPFYVFGLIGVVWSVIWLFLDVKTLSWSSKPSIFGTYKEKIIENYQVDDNIILQKDLNESNLNQCNEIKKNYNFFEVETKAKSNSIKEENFKKFRTDYLNKSEKIIGFNHNKKVVNFRLILNLLKNRSIFAIIVAQYCHGWTQFGFVTWMPIYYSDVNHVHSKYLGYYTTPPWVLQAIFIIVFGYLADWLVSSSTFRSITVRKLFQFLSMFFGSISQLALIILNQMGLTSPSYTLVVVCIMFIFNTMSCGGVTVYQFDIAPTFPAVVYAIGNTFGTIAGLFSVSLTGLILNKSEMDFESRESNLDENKILERWKVVLLIYAIHNLIGGIIFIFLGEEKPIFLIETKPQYFNQEDENVYEESCIKKLKNEITH